MVGVNHRVVTLAVLVLVTALTARGLPQLVIDTGFSSLISDSDPDTLIYDLVAREFGTDNRTIVYVKDAKLWTQEKIAALERLHYALEGLDFVVRVDDFFNLRSIRGAGDTLTSQVLLAETPNEQSVIDAARSNALANPLIVGNFLSADGTAAAIMVSVRERYDEQGFDSPRQCCPGSGSRCRA